IMFRGLRQPDFGEDEILTAARALPLLAAAARRCDRFAPDGAAQVMEGLLDDADDRAHIALTCPGPRLWLSRSAARLPESRVGPDELVAAARRIGDLARRGTPSTFAPSTNLAIVLPRGNRLSADLRLARTRTGEPFIAVALTPCGSCARLDELRARYRLTAAE